jgi:hypothetical protein
LGTSRGEVPPESALAIRVGADAWEWLTAADRSGRVGGCFRGGVNAVFGSEALVCLQSPSIPIHPWALVAGLPWEEVAEGAPVTVSRGELSVGRFVLPLGEVEAVDLAFHPPENLVSLEELQERIALIEQLLAETPDPFDSEFDHAFVRDRDRILAEWQESGDPEVLLNLIGRGPGTTPAGDDTLIGLLAGLEVLAAVRSIPGLPLLHATRHMLLASLSEPRTSNPELPCRSPQTTCHKPLACVPFHTSSLSAQLLASAAAGEFPSALLSFDSTILDCVAARSQVARSATEALNVGQTTGSAALLGIIAALPAARCILAGQATVMCYRKS